MSRKKPEIPYALADNFILRCPLFSLNFFHRLHLKPTIPNEVFLKLFSNPIIEEAIYISSYDLYRRLKKWNDGFLLDEKEISKLKISFLKYLTRMSTRCTPFGIFASTGTGEFSSKPTTLSLDSLKRYRKHTRFDMAINFVLAKEAVYRPEMFPEIIYYPNNSLYKIGGNYRFVEGTLENNKRQYTLQLVETTWYLELIIKASKTGKSTTQLCELLVNHGFGTEDSRVYVFSLISSQILSSAIEPKVTGIELLEKIAGDDLVAFQNSPMIKRILELNTSLKGTEDIMGTPVEEYENIRNAINQLDLNIDGKHLIQIDLYSNSLNNDLNKKLKENILEGLNFFNKITGTVSNSNLIKFKENFLKRYGQEEMDLTEVLDPEMGIGYGVERNDIHPFLEDLEISLPSNEHKNIKWLPFDDKMLPLVLDSIKNKEFEINLSKSIVKEMTANWEDLPTTFSALIEVYNIEGEEKVFIAGAGGSSAVNLLARFCDGNNEVNRNVKEIIQIEEGFHSDKIFAEVVHLPQIRTGNILKRPSFRKYEIPYLAQSSLPLEFQILISDLMVSIKQDKVILRSKNLNKEVIPYQTTAHNYKIDALPIYHFLCDLQTQNLRSNIGFQWNIVFEKFNFLPRINYENLIISKARWLICKSEILHFNNLKEKKLMHSIVEWRLQLNIPRYVMIIDGDNKLLIDFENINSIQMFLSEIRKTETPVLEEFLFNEGGLVRRCGESLCNQLILSFYKNNNLS